MRTEECIFFQLAKAGQNSAQYWQGKVAPLGLTAVQAMVLNTLSDDDGAPAGRLGERIQLTSATLTGIIDRLENLGFAERRASKKDRRAVLVCLTGKGRQVVAEIKPLLVDANQEFLADLSPREQKQLLGLLQKLRDSRQGEATPTA
ncbi:MAG: MarR family transcriptional regulator [Deltaproteobacteria bacterium]|nr:MarR family transcriptional regulator [Deltaproteobacteria bacterium]